MMKRLFYLALLGVLLFLASTATAQGQTVTEAAQAAAQEMDRQVVSAFSRTAYDVIVTTPVNLNNLEKSCPLARLMAEELAASLVRLGYGVQEARKARAILMDPAMGETLLTRDASKLGTAKPITHIVLTGTYLVTPFEVRFNVRLVNSSSTDVLAMSGQSVAITPAVASLVSDGDCGVSLYKPTVATRLRPN